MTDKVLLCSQAYAGADMRFINQIILTLANPPEGIQLGYNFTQCSCIDVGLAMAATDFLKTDFDFLLSQDYDILYNPRNDPTYRWGAEIKQIVESCKETGGLVGGPYLKRGGDGQLCVVPLKEEEIIIGPGGGLHEVKWLPTGYTCISRKILEDMASAMPLVEYDEKTHIYPFFMSYIYEEGSKKIYMSHDYAFSQRCRDMGYRNFLDTRIILGHLGQTVLSVHP